MTRLSLNTRNIIVISCDHQCYLRYLVAILRSRNLLKQTYSVPALLAPAHEISRRIKILNAYCREAMYLEHPVSFIIIKLQIFKKIVPESAKCVCHPPLQTDSHTDTHTLTHTLNHMLTHTLTHTLTHALTHTLIHTLIHTLTHTLTHRLTHTH